MRQSEDHVVALLLEKLRNVPGEVTRKCLAGSTGERSFAEIVVDLGLLPPAEVAAFHEAARFLIAGDHLRACATAECRTQLIVPARGGAACPRCGKPLLRGVLPASRAYIVDPQLDRQVRRLILESIARAHTQGRVAEANRLRVEGKVGRRPESELAPKDRSVAEPTLGNYKLLALVGRGSSSYVYKAEDTRDGRVVALKVLYFAQGEPESSVREKLARFRREAELASRLEHPNLVPVGPIETAGPWHFLPLAFVDGPTLAQVLEARDAGRAAGAPPAAGTDLQALAGALGDVARGLHYAHCQGVIHRDVNPRNILFSSTGHAYLSDFGVARPIDGSSTLTAEKAVLGTLEYAAPERLESESQADARSDVYSLGVVLYQILAGRLPYAGGNPMLLLGRIRQSPPPGARQFNPEVTAALESTGAKALAADPSRRYPSALDFAEALSDAVAGEGDGPAAPAVPPPADGKSAPAARGRMPLGRLVAAVSLAFAAGLATMAAVSDAGEPDEAALRAALSGLNRRALEAASGAECAAVREAMRRGLERLVRRIGPDDPQAALWRGHLAWTQGDLAAAEASYDAARAAPAPPPDAALAHARTACLLAERYGKSERAKQLRAAALEDCRRIAGSAAASWEGKFAGALLSLLNDDPDGAFAAFHALAREDLSRPEATFMESWVALRFGTAGTAAATLETLLAARPAHPYARMSYALALVADGKPDRALEQVATLRQLWPAMYETDLIEGLARLRAQDPEAALGPLDRAALRDPKAVEGHRLSAAAYRALGRPCEEAAALARVLALDPAAEDALFRHGEVLLDHGDEKRGAAALTAYLKKYPQGKHVSRAHALLGE